MTEMSMAAMYKLAQEEGVTADLLPLGPQNFVIHRFNIRPNQKTGLTSFGILVKITSGPDAGTAGWINQSIGPSNPTGNGIFFRLLESFGLTKDYYLAEGVGLPQIGEALMGRQFSAEVEHREWTGKKDGKKNVSNHLANIVLGGQAAAPVPAAPAAVPEAPVAPAPAAPPPAAVPAPPAVPAVPVPPAPASVPVPTAPAPPVAVPAPPAAPAVPVTVDPQTGVPQAPTF